MSAAVITKRPGGFPKHELWDFIGYKEIQRAVGGIFCCALSVRLPGIAIDCWCHDEGLLIGLPLNFIRHTDGAPIVGPVLFTGCTPHGDSRGLTEREIEWLFVDPRSPLCGMLMVLRGKEINGEADRPVDTGTT